MSAGKVVKKRHEPTFAEIFLSQTVTIKVGYLGKKYQVHKALLMRYSEYFRRELERGDSKEGTLGKDILQYIWTVPFKALVDWMYSKKLPYRTDDWIKYGGKEELEHVLDLNILAHCLIIPDLTRPALKLAVDVLNSRPHPEYCFSSDAFRYLPEDHPLLQLLIDYHCRSYTLENFNRLMKFVKDNPTRVMTRVLKKYSEMVDRDDEQFVL